MRVALSQFTAWPEVRRGAERYVHELAWALAARGHEVQVVTSAPEPRNGQVLRVPTFWLPRSSSTSFGGRAPRMLFGRAAWTHVRKAQPDVWHANSLYDGAAAALWAARHQGRGAVFTLHGPADPRRLRHPADRLSFAAVRHGSSLVTVSEPAARELGTDFGVGSHVVSPGVDTTSFVPGGSRSARPSVLYVGTLAESRKNVPLLLQAVGCALEDGCDLEVWLAGQGDAAPLLAQAPARVRDRVRVLGSLEGDALVEAYQRAWVTALVSRREVFGMAVVESLACGTPAVVLADGWGPERIVLPGSGFAAAAEAPAVGRALQQAVELASRPGTADTCRGVAEAYDWVREIAPRMEQVYAASLAGTDL